MRESGGCSNRGKIQLGVLERAIFDELAAFFCRPEVPLPGHQRPHRNKSRLFVVRYAA